MTNLYVNQKNSLRETLKILRGKIPNWRKKQASDLICGQISSFFPLLSFASLPDEIDLWPLNQKLAAAGNLLLPKVSGEELVVYQVDSFAEQLFPSKWGILEPSQCQPYPLDKISCVLVPGLGFDQNKRRIGYGKGHYDRFLAQLKRQAPQAIAIGVGFCEQLVEEGIPVEEHDFLLDQVLLT
jgi:5-formyltetrahydrofolate cyclo-ligase